MRKSQEGHDSTGSSRMTLSPKMTVSKSPFAINLLRTLRQGLERAYFRGGCLGVFCTFASSAHTPTMNFALTC